MSVVPTFTYDPGGIICLQGDLHPNPPACREREKAIADPSLSDELAHLQGQVVRLLKRSPDPLETTRFLARLSERLHDLSQRAAALEAAR